MNLSFASHTNLCGKDLNVRRTARRVNTMDGIYKRNGKPKKRAPQITLDSLKNRKSLSQKVVPYKDFAQLAPGELPDIFF